MLNPRSFVLHFAYAESLELQKKLPEVHALYTTFVEVLERDLDAVEARESPNNTVANVSLASLHANTTAANGTLNGSSAGPAYGDASQQSSQDSQVSTASRPSKSKELAEKRTQYALVWITYMRFARRAESLQSARDVFKKARTARWTSWEVYEAAGACTAVVRMRV
jgi:cleavage stimulation factor subunit 3